MSEGVTEARWGRAVTGNNFKDSDGQDAKDGDGLEALK